MQTNITAKLTPAQIRGVTDMLQKLQDKLPPLVPLTAEERQRAGRLGDRKLGFMMDCQEVVAANAAILPESFDSAEFKRQVELSLELQECVAVLKQITSDVEDTLCGVGNEAFKTSQVAYTYVKTAARHMPGLKLAAERLSEHFSRERTAKVPSSEEPSVTAAPPAVAPQAATNAPAPGGTQ